MSRHSVTTVLATAMLLAVVLLAACDNTGPARPQAGSYAAEIEAWRASRLESLKAPFGWLNLAGLYWVQPGEYTVGSAQDSAIRLGDFAPARFATIHRDGNRIEITATDGVQFHDGERELTSGVMIPDTGEAPTTLTSGAVALRLIERNGEYALRVWNLEHPGSRNFAGLPYFDIDRGYRLQARFQPYDEPRKLRVQTVVTGLDYRPVAPGALHFELDGRPHSLEVYDAGDSFFVIFADVTSHSETYPAGRFLYTDLPGEDGTVTLDFNKAYNPPCAFNEFATCPIASRRNRLEVAVTAGEKYTDSLHVQ